MESFRDKDQDEAILRWIERPPDLRWALPLAVFICLMAYFFYWYLILPNISDLILANVFWIAGIICFFGLHPNGRLQARKFRAWLDLGVLPAGFMKHIRPFEWGVFLTIFLVANVFVFLPMLRGSGSMDGCFDRGGSWDYENRICSDTCEKRDRIWDPVARSCGESKS